MLATHNPFEEELEVEAVVKQSTKKQKDTPWVASPTAFAKMQVSQAKQTSSKPTQFDYKATCALLKLPLKQFQIFELSDKQRLEQLYEKFERWIVESKKDLKHLVPSIVFWQQFEFAIINPANANLAGTPEGKYLFKELQLHEPKNIMYIKGYQLESVLLSTEQLNIETGNDARYQFHLLTATIHPIVAEFLESL